MRGMTRRVAVAAVLVLGVLPATMGAGGGCGEMGDTGAQHGNDPIVQLPKDNAAKKVKFTVTWEPADIPVQVWTAINGQATDHGVKHTGQFKMDGLASNSAGLDARALYRPRSLHCDMQVGGQHYEHWAAVEKGEWSCFAHWSTNTPPNA